ncbi:Eco57I restriction-modification methylase domain-containing protein [Nodularia spumigena]|uniref:Eco57I restriction-modification methylase domain-containing protein n=1 Tax=Nodularia spumigena TaxID=70799 RepID=UPI002330A879|nr:N-6 DNA methylase [Nodularia spumigena]MDB9317719.1 Eco57I restriction-modification methylase domain-containing protein [Nodularia spumigena CS-590/01A]MDB9326118.1 Eco57I restriction-modification methylase domain-containing protein [Nodularia spumigena CS-590/02]
MNAPLSIIQLVDYFHQQIDLYKGSGLNETQTRIQFIDPFFAALGWDISNEKQVSDIYQDVVHEDRLKISDAKKAKAPDYSFRVGGVRKFFVEAKKPAVNVGTNISAAFQLRRYGWSAKLPVSILTDFEEFSVYDCRIMPNKNDPASQGRIKYFKYTEYVEKWEEIYQLFSKEAVLNGSLEKFAETKVKAGVTVDQAFLREIETWRENLAANIAWRNPQIKQRDLNFAVQITINRIIFLRICEDREIEIYEQLLNLLKFQNIYQELGRLFINADYRYNSGLFYFQQEKGREQPDDFTLNLTIEDYPLRAIIKKLYPPESPYEFSVIPVEILGQVYEQFLGKIITLSASRQAVVEDKPEVRKAGGVYYTPSYIVDYIVKETIGKFLEGKKPEKVQEMSIIDPACGSGSFLIVAYQFLLDWYLQQYLQNLKKYKNKIYQVTGNSWRLTSTERKRILLAHIYGIDIDQQAVETTKLSLLLKVLEGESVETITKQLEFLKERALPDLDNNIQCGNSLIDGEFYQNNQLDLLDEDTSERINIFDWETGFSAIMKRGGFDIVIGNPPYIRIQALKEWAALEVEFYQEKYVSAKKGNYDIYVIFVEKGLNLLTKDGRLGFILPHKFFNAQYGELIRGFIAENKSLNQIIHFGDKQVFTDATTYTCLLFLSKQKNKSFEVKKIHSLIDWRSDENKNIVRQIFPMSYISHDEWNFVMGRDDKWFSKINNISVKLGDIAHLFVGLQTDADDIFIMEQVCIENQQVLCKSQVNGKLYWLENNFLKYFLKGSLNICRYSFKNVNKRLIFPYETINNKSVLLSAHDYEKRFPLTWNYIQENQDRLAARNKGKMGTNWYGYVYHKNHTRFDSPKLLVPAIGTGSCFTADLNGGYYFVGSGGGGGGGYGISLLAEINISYFYVLGILNSQLINKFLQLISTPFRGGYIALSKQFIQKIPIKLLDLSKSTDQVIHHGMIRLVEQMLALHQQLNEVQTPPAKKRVIQQIKATDRQINQLVYELYELTDEEIAIVEG